MNQSKKQTGLRALASFSVTIASFVSVASCSDKRHDCSWLANCETSAADQGVAGNSAGAASTSDSCKGQCAGTASTLDPCKGQCAGTSTPLCRVTGTSSTCVECRTNQDCPQARPLCDGTGRCRQCLVNRDCKTAEASRCDLQTQTCIGCQTDEDCSQISGKSVCAIESANQTSQAGQAATPQSSGLCVQCTGKNSTYCGSAANGKLRTCDSLKHECTTYVAQSSGLCQACVSDAQCKPGMLCYQQSFAGSPVGYFCFFKQNDTANATPADCAATTNRPYVKAQANAVSIDNESATLCVLRTSTCTALNACSAYSCLTGSLPDDALCGFAPGTDSKCTAYGTAGQYRCTTTCLSNDDCVGQATCDTGANPRVCAQ